MARNVVHEEEEQVEQDVEVEGAEWTREEAAKFLHQSVMTVRRLESQGKLTPMRKAGTRGGRIVYAAAEVAALRGSPAVDVAADDELKAKELVAAAVSMAAQSADHAAFMLQLVQEPAKELLQMAMDENARLRERIQQLEVARVEAFDKMEEMRTKDHERQLEMMQWASRDERQRSILTLIMENAPVITQQIVASGQGPEMLGSLSSLAKSLTSDQVGRLMDILDNKQATALAKVLGSVNTTGKTVSTSDEAHSLLRE